MEIFPGYTTAKPNTHSFLEQKKAQILRFLAGGFHIAAFPVFGCVIDSTVEFQKMNVDADGV